jgi:ABC-type branched-subunit amino acid transport system substrate-binding protein
MPWSSLTLVLSFLYAVFNLNATIASVAIDSYFDSQKKDTITIGLLVDNLQDGEQAILAAQLAINQSNLDRGESGSLFKLAVREMDGPWGQASNKTVELIYEEMAVAIVGALDGRTAHLAEQVTAKSQIPYIETKATDPSLSKAFVPWFFRLIPNDYQVAKALTKDIYEQNNFSQVAIISDSSYDSKIASQAIKRIIRENELIIPASFVVDDRNPDYSSLVAQLMAEDFQAIVFLTNIADEQPNLERLIEHSTARIYLNQLSVELKEPPSYPLYTISAVANTAKYENFKIQFQKYSNSKPTAQAIYVFDAINILLHTINAIGSNPEIIGQNIGKMDVYNGVSGKIKFDQYGDIIRMVQFTR